MVYLREAHAANGMAFGGSNTQYEVAQHIDMKDRIEAAKFLKTDLFTEYGMDDLAIYCDNLENEIQAVYDSFPTKIIILDAAGKILGLSNIRQFDDIVHALNQLLQDKKSQ